MEERDLARIRFVSLRYRELQGLRQVAIVLACLFSFWARPYVEGLRYFGGFQAVIGFFLAVLPLVIMLTAHPLLDRYYARRFGSVAGNSSWWSRDVVGWTVLLVGGAVIDIETYRQTEPIAFLIAGALVAVHIVLRDWPWRAHHLFTAGLCAIGAWLVAFEPAVQVTSLDQLVRGPFSMMLAAHLAGACFDHRLLVRTLPLNPDARGEELADHADAV